MEEALLGKYLDGCFEDPIIFVVYFFFGSNNTPP